MSMRIEIFANGLSSVSELQSGLDMLHSRISSTISDLQDVKRRMSKMTGGLGLLSDAYQNVQRRVQKEERRMTAVERVSEASQNFLSNTVSTDNRVARLVNQNQEKFFRSHAWLRPAVEEEKSWWEQRLEDWNDFWGDVGEFLKSASESIANWVKEHAVELIIGTVAILIGAVLTVLTGGTFLAALAAGLQAAVISAAISAALSAGIAALTGGDVLEAFGDGLASGYMWGGIFFALSKAITLIKTIKAKGQTGTKGQGGATQTTKTKPSGKPNPNAKPDGNPATPHPHDDAQKVHNLMRENESADLLAKNGYKVKQNPTQSEIPSIYKGKNPDYLVEGRVFDCYTPSSDKIESVLKGIADKVTAGQTNRVVVNLNDNIYSIKDVKVILEQFNIPGLKEVIAIKGEIVKHIFFR